MVEFENTPYFALFHGQDVLLSAVQERAAYAMVALDILLKEGNVVGQRLLFSQEDMMLHYIGKHDIRKELEKHELRIGAKI